MNKTKVMVGPIELNVWNDYYGAPNRLSPTRPEAFEICQKENAAMVTVPVALAIFHAASLKITGTPLGAGSQSEMRGKLEESNKKINSKIPPNSEGLLIAGHMKDLVLSEKLTKDNIVIWGWLRNNQKPENPVFWQPEFGGHYFGWADYSQGLRLVDRECFIHKPQPNGDLIVELKDLQQLYQDPEYSRFLTLSGKPLLRPTYQR